MADLAYRSTQVATNTPAQASSPVSAAVLDNSALQDNSVAIELLKASQAGPLAKAAQSGAAIQALLTELGGDDQLSADEVKSWLKSQDLFNRLERWVVTKKLMGGLDGNDDGQLGYDELNGYSWRLLTGILGSGPQSETACASAARKVFLERDTDKDGKVSRKELEAGVRAKIDPPLYKDEIVAMSGLLSMTLADTDKNGGITLEEFVAATLSLFRSAVEHQQKKNASAAPKS